MPLISDPSTYGNWQLPKIAPPPEEEGKGIYTQVPFSDPRTANAFGAFTEDEIEDAVREEFSTAVTAMTDPATTGALKPALDTAINQDNDLTEQKKNVFEILGDEFVLSRAVDARNLSAYRAMITGEQIYHDEMLRQSAEVEKLQMSQPTGKGMNLLTRVAKATVGMAGNISGQIGGVWDAPWNPGAKAVAGVTHPMKVVSGGIYADLADKLDEKTGITISRESAREAALLFGAPAGALEFAGEAVGGKFILSAAFKIGGPALERVAKLALNAAVESGTEGAQTVMENMARIYALNNELEKLGLPKRQYTVEALLEDTSYAMTEAALGSLGLGGLAVGTGAVARKTLHPVIEKKLAAMQQRKEEQREANRAAIRERLVKAKQEEAKQNAVKPVAPAIDEDGVEIESAPLTDEEIARAHSSFDTQNMGIKDGDLDDMTLLETDEDVDAAIARIDAEIDRSASDIDYALEFGVSLREVLDDNQAETVESLVAARAKALGMSTNEYLKQRQITLEAEQRETGQSGELASVTFTREGETIIRAFQAANVSSIIHEIGHIFRRELPQAELDILESWAEVVDGKWTVESEEKFARAWERYIYDGIAPDGAMEKVFVKLRDWMVEVYQALDGSPIDVEITDEVRGVFDRLLQEGQQAKLETEFANQDDMLLQIQPENRISTRYPTAVGTTYDELREVDIDAARSREAFFDRNLQLVKSKKGEVSAKDDKPAYTASTYAGFKTNKRNSDKIAEEYINHTADNLVWLYNMLETVWGAGTRDRAKLWYVGANRIAEDFARRYNLDPRIPAAIMAALSPQKDWDQNVSLAERVMDIWLNVPDDTVLNDIPEMMRIMKPEKGGVSVGNRKLIQLIAGKPVGQITDTAQLAVWIRVYDQIHNPPGYRIITPEGDFIGEATGKVAWGSIDEIEKAVKILNDPTVNGINANMGYTHKIRNFYNNIVDPSNARDVTIDTHAVAALLLLPLSSGAFEVAHNFGSGAKGSSKSKHTGLSGLYFLNAEAYRVAAERVGLLPREMQSITWEGVRGLFTATYKRGLAVDEQDLTDIHRMWQAYERGELTKDQVRERIVYHASGIDRPRWDRSGSEVAEPDRGTSYEGSLHRPGIRGESPTLGGRTRSALAGRATAGQSGRRVDETLYQVQPGAQSKIDQAKYDILVAKAYRRIKRQALSTEAEKRLNSIVDPQARKKMGPKALFRAQVKALRMIMQESFDAGNKIGYELAKAEMKALLLRERERRSLGVANKKTKDRIYNTLKKAQPGKKGGKRKSGYSADTTAFVQELYTEMKAIRKMGKQQLKKWLDDRIANMGDPTRMTDVDLWLQTYVDLFTNADSRPGSKAFAQYEKALREYLASERKKSPFQQTVAAAKALRDEVLPHIVGEGVDVEAELAKATPERLFASRRASKSLKQRLATNTFLGKYIYGWNGLLSLITSYAPADRIGIQTVLHKALDFYENRQQREKDVREAEAAMHKAIAGIFGFTGNATAVQYKVMRKIAKDTQNIFELGLLHNEKFSMSQIRQIWMYIQDPSLTKRLANMGINQMVRDRINAILDAHQGEREFAQWQLDQYRSDAEYGRNNAVYKRVYGTDLTRLENYVPVRGEWYVGASQRERNEGGIIPQMAMDRIMRTTPESAKSLKERATDAWRSKLLLQGDVALYTGWQSEMAHFRAYAEKVRLARQLLNDRLFRGAVIMEYGTETEALMRRALDDIAANGSARYNDIALIDRFRSAWVVSNIGLAAGPMMKQLISIVNYWQYMPIGDYVGGLVSFWADPKKNWKEMLEIYDSEYLQNRRSIGIDRDLITSRPMQAALHKYKLNPSLENLFTMNIRLGDNAAIMIGGWLMLRHLMTNSDNMFGRKLTREEALIEIGRLSDQTQQSAAVEELSELQRGGSLAKALTTFSTGPVQAIRQELLAVRNYAGGRITGKQLAKTLFVYQILVPTLYSLAASMISDEDVEEAGHNVLFSWILGPFGATYSVGRTLTNLLRRALGMKYYQDVGIFPDVMTNIVDLTKDDVTFDDVAGAMQSALTIMNYRVPLQRATRIVQNAVEGDVEGAVFGSNPDNN